MSKVICGYGRWFLRLLDWTQGVPAWWKETAQAGAFLLSSSLLLNHFEPQSSKIKLLLLIMTIGIVVYACTAVSYLFINGVLNLHTWLPASQSKPQPTHPPTPPPSMWGIRAFCRFCPEECGALKALANKDTLLPTQMFPCLPARVTFVADTTLRSPLCFTMRSRRRENFSVARFFLKLVWENGEDEKGYKL